MKKPTILMPVTPQDRAYIEAALDSYIMSRDGPKDERHRKHAIRIKEKVASLAPGAACPARAPGNFQDGPGV